jgi:hypothetical protein
VYGPWFVIDQIFGSREDEEGTGTREGFRRSERVKGWNGRHCRRKVDRITNRRGRGESGKGMGIQGGRNGRRGPGRREERRSRKRGEKQGMRSETCKAGRED